MVLREGQQVVTHGTSQGRPGDSLDVMAVDDGSVDITTIIKQQKKDDMNKKDQNNAGQNKKDKQP